MSALMRVAAWIKDIKPQATSGGTFTSGAWRTRTLNTIENDINSIVLELNANQFRMKRGVFHCFATCPAHSVNRHQARLYNVTQAAIAILGTPEYTAPTQTHSIIDGQFTVTDENDFYEIQHICSGTVAGQGFGVEGNFTTEIFTQARFSVIGF